MVKVSSSSSLHDEPPTPRSKTSFHQPEKPKGRMKAPNDLQRIFHSINQKGSIYYISKAKSVNKEPSEERSRFTSYDFPSSTEHFTYKSVSNAWKKKIQRDELNKKCHLKSNARSRLSKDILNRLYVKDPDDIKGVKTILQTDPEFYTIVEARPIFKPYSKTKYLEDIRNVLRTQLMTGFRNDEILLIDEKLKREKSALVQIRSNYQTYLNSFETCLREDYTESMTLLREAEKVGIITMDKSELIRQLHTENAALEFTVHKLEEHWRDLKLYQKFLYFVSPITWRKQYDYIHRKELESEIEEETSCMFRKYTLTSHGQLPSLTSLVDEYLETLKDEEEPVLYFTHTDQLVKVFRFIELQNLNCLLHTDDIEIPMETMKATMKEAKKDFIVESTSLQKIMNNLIKGIEWEESCAKELEDTAMKQVDTTFRNLISDDEVLKLHVFVEDVFDSCVAKNTSQVSLIDMMISIEECYNNLVLNLDGLPQHIVKKAEKFRFAEQARLAKLCEDTAIKIAMVESITWRLKKSLEPPFVKKRDLMFRSAPPDKVELPPAPPRELTERETDYLTYFTDYCALTDDVRDYGIQLDRDETEMKKFSIVL